jgi:hypothetical protein
VLVDSTGLKVYGARARRRWRKLHLAQDADNGEIIAHCRIDPHADDPSQVESLLDRIDGEVE